MKNERAAKFFADVETDQSDAWLTNTIEAAVGAAMKGESNGT